MRCGWLNYKGRVAPDFYIDYHDKDWGAPVHDDRLLFEFLILEGAQAGLSWETILKRRDSYRKAYDNFDVKKISEYDDAKKQELLQNAGIIRNRLKVDASISNAKAFLGVQSEFGSFDSYIWGFTGGRTIQNNWKSLDEVPASSDESIAMSSDLKKRGFKFVGATICYAFMQAIGMVNDHETACFRHSELK